VGGDLAALGGTSARSCAIAGGRVERAVGSDVDVAKASGLVLEIPLVRLDSRRIGVAELHPMEVLRAERSDQQAAPPLRDGAAPIEGRSARRHGLFPRQ